MYVPSLDGTRDAVGKALLQAEEDDGGWQRADQNAQHQHAVVHAVTTLEVGDQHRHRDRAVVLKYDLRPQVAVPCVHEGDCHGSAVGRAHDGNEHEEEDTDLAQTLQTCGLDDIAGETARRLAEQHDHKRR